MILCKKIPGEKIPAQKIISLIAYDAGKNLTASYIGEKNSNPNQITDTSTQKTQKSNGRPQKERVRNRWPLYFIAGF